MGKELKTKDNAPTPVMGDLSKRKFPDPFYGVVILKTKENAPSLFMGGHKTKENVPTLFMEGDLI